MRETPGGTSPRHLSTEHQKQGDTHRPKDAMDSEKARRGGPRISIRAPAPAVHVRRGAAGGRLSTPGSAATTDAPRSTGL